MIGNVADFAFDKKGRISPGSSIRRTRRATGCKSATWNRCHSILGIRRPGCLLADVLERGWREPGAAESARDRTPGDMRYFVVGLTAFGSGTPQKTVFNPATATGFPAGMIVSPNRSPVWSDDRAALLFGIQIPRKAAARIGDGAAADPRQNAAHRSPNGDSSHR